MTVVSHRMQIVAFAAALSACGLLATACDHETETGPTPAVTAGDITYSPPGVGLASITEFSFTAQGFTSSNGGPLTYLWDFGDGAKTTGGATITHMFRDPAMYDVWVTATNNAGVSASARASRVRVIDLTDRWYMVDASGKTIMDRIALTHNRTIVWGDQTFTNCRYAISGSVAAPRSLTLTFTRPPGDCQAVPWMPVTFTFAATADDSFWVFTGAMAPGGPGTMARCVGPWVCP